MARPALWMAAALALGISAADWLRPHPLLALAAVLALAAWTALARRRAAVLLLLTVAGLGALRFAYVQTAGRGDLGAWEGRKVTITGTVTGEPELKQPRGVGYALDVEQVEGHPAAGRVYVTQWGGTAPGYGERVELRGTLKPPQGPRTPGGFDRAAYLARQSIYLTLDAGEAQLQGPGGLSWLQRAAVSARLRLEGVLKATLPPRDAALMAGLLFGSRSELPDEIKEAFKTSGVFHLLAVSGGNVAMVIMPILLLLRRVGMSKRWAAATAIPVVIFFVFLTGASPSVMRAGLMAVLVLLGDLLHREKDALNTLAAAALLLLLWSPGLLFDLGFQLSAGATLGILLYARHMERWLSQRFQPRLGEKAGGWLAAGLSVTFAAQVLVEPLTLHNFGAISLIAPVANLVVLAFIEIIVQIGSVAVLVGLVLPPLAWLLNLPVRAGLWLLLFSVDMTAAIPGAYLEPGRLPLVFVLTWYAGLAAATVPILRRALLARVVHVRATLGVHRAAARRWTAVSLGLVLATGFTWRLALADPPDTLLVTFLDIGQGDAILIQAPGGESMLVDPGPYVPGDPRTGRPGYDAGAEVVLPYLAQRGVRRLDYLVLTQPDQDHAGGGPSVLEGVRVGAVWYSDAAAKEGRYREALELAAAKGIPARQPLAGEQVTLGREVRLEILNPRRERFAGTRSDDNSNCIAFRLVYRRMTMLFTCDMEAVVEEDWLARRASIKADLLKVAHHGSGYSSTEPFLKAVQARWAVISVGNGNMYGHPSKGALERLAATGAEVWRTDRHGTVSARTDGLTLTLTGTKGRPEDERYRPLGILGRRWFFAW